MTVAACPKPELLAAFARGDLAPDELAAVADHVGACEACCRSLRGLPEDSLAGLARAAAADPTEMNATNVSPRRAGHVLAPAEVPPQEVPDGFANHPRYRIISQIGAGGMGTVYKAEDQLMGRVVAIKVVSPQLTSHESAVERFRREIRVAAQLNDPRVIIAHDTGEAGGCHFLVMEFVEGISLDRLVAKKGPLPVQMACAFARQAALGLQHAADKGMVHRDIKPQNLMVTRKGQVKILDFGLARFASGDHEKTLPGGRPAFGAGKQAAGGVTNPNFVMGTPDYLSPEQASDSHNVDHRSDVYSLGCTLYFLLTAHPPFAGAETLIDKLVAHTEQEPPPVRTVRTDVSEGLAEVLAKMMAKRREDRYQTAAEAAAALHPFARGAAPGAGSPDQAAAEPTFEIVEATVLTPAPRAGSTSATAFDTGPPADSPTLAESPRPKRAKKKRKRASWLKRHRDYVLAGGVALALLAAGLFVLKQVQLKKPGDKASDPNASANAAGANGGTKDSTPPRQAATPPAANSGSKGGAWVPSAVVAAPGNEVLVLVVVPSRGVWFPDFDSLRDALTAGRVGGKPVRVETASARGGRATPASGSPGPPEGIAIDVKLTEATNLAKYSAVVFCGFDVNEYLGGGAGWRAAAHAIKSMQSAGKPVGSVCTGQAVLAAHGVLKGRKAVPPPPGFGDKFRDALADPAIKWQKWPVAADDSGGRPVVTVAGPPQAQEFAAALLKAIEGK